jgi:uncharacterized protein (UPF0332 family)
LTPEAEQPLEKARQTLSKATIMLNAGLPDEAGRCAYLAAFHAAQALIFEQTGRTPKTHHGVRTAFARLATTEPGFEPSLRRFLTHGYDLKSLADYAIGPAAIVSTELATDAIDHATLFVNRIESALS